MDTVTVCTIVGSVVAAVLAIMGLNIALFSWLRSDMKSFEDKITGWKEEINKEMKDFHGRLCAIEEKSKLKNSLSEK